MAKLDFNLPTREAVNDFKLSRFPNRKTADNPFLKGVNIGTDVSRNGQNGNASYSESDDDSYNEIKIDFYKYQTIKNTTKRDPSTGLVVSELDYGTAGGPEIVSTFRILADEENKWVANHQHTWKKPAAPKSVTSPATEYSNSVNSMSANFGRAQGALGLIGMGGNYGAGIGQKIDMQVQYDSSSNNGDGGFGTNISFKLFTADNFYRDIFYPIQNLVYFSYPRRKEPPGLVDNVLASVGGAAPGILMAGVAGAAGSGLKGGLKGLAKGLTGAAVRGAANSAKNFANQNVLALNSRTYFFEYPHLCNIRHMSGLFFYKNCYIQNISVTYGTEYYMEKAEVDNEPERNISFPTTAKVNLTVTSTENMFADDWLAQLSAIKSGAQIARARSVDEATTSDSITQIIHDPSRILGL
jgi:hypothetical protein